MANIETNSVFLALNSNILISLWAGLFKYNFLKDKAFLFFFHEDKPSSYLLFFEKMIYKIFILINLFIFA